MTLSESPDTKTLAHVLEACKGVACVPEKYWVVQVRSIARGDQLALHALYTRTCRIVFTWVLQVAPDRASAETATVDVFHEVWRRASKYDAGAGSVLAWILALARSRMSGRPAAQSSIRPGAEVSYPALWKRLARRLAAETGRQAVVSPHQAPEAEWEDVAPGISCTLLARDPSCGQVTLLVRLAPGVRYPAHTHAGVEELYMLEGELKVDGRSLRAGDYLRSEPGTSDRVVWSATGCRGVLLTSSRDLLL